MFGRRGATSQNPSASGQLEVSAVAVVRAPLEEVWDFVEEPAFALLDPMIEESTWLGDRRGVGALQVFVHRVEGVPKVGAIEIVEYERLSRAVYCSAGALDYLQPTGGSVEMSEHGDVVRVVLSSWMDVSRRPALGRQDERMTARLQLDVDAQVRRVSQRFAPAGDAY